MRFFLYCCIECYYFYYFCFLLFCFVFVSAYYIVLLISAFIFRMLASLVCYVSGPSLYRIVPLPSQSTRPPVPSLPLCNFICLFTTACLWYNALWVYYFLFTRIDFVHTRKSQQPNNPTSQSASNNNIPTNKKHIRKIETKYAYGWY